MPANQVGSALAVTLVIPGHGAPRGLAG